MAWEDLVVDRPGPGVAVLAFNRPDRLNAVTVELQRHLDDVLTLLEADSDVRCVVITGTGERAFSAGYDVHEMAAWSDDELLASLRERERWIWHVATTPLPVVAALNGVTYGVGAILATAADVRIGCDSTVFRFTAGAHGGANATWSLPALVGRGRAAELLMTAREVHAGEAERIGLLNRLVAQEDLMEAALKTARQIAANPPEGVRAIKRLLREHAGRALEDRFEAENLAMRTELRPAPISELYAEFLE